MTNKIDTILPLALAAGFAFFGAQKFGAENIVFETLATRSGIELFEPYARYATGAAEFAAAALLALPRSRTLGLLFGLAILLGAIGLHLSPWLGIVVPGIGIGLFLTAVAMLAVTGFALARRIKALRLTSAPRLSTRLAPLG